MKQPVSETERGAILIASQLEGIHAQLKAQSRMLRIQMYVRLALIVLLPLAVWRLNAWLGL
jgi:hypothetical protein